MEVQLRVGVMVAYPSLSWRRYQVRHDWLSGVWAYEVREVAPDPEVNRIGSFNDHNNHNKAALTRAMQFFWADLMAQHKFGRVLAQCSEEQAAYIREKFQALIGPEFAFTNRDPNAPVADYVNNHNVEFEPPRLAPLVCGGCTVYGKPAGRNKKGREMVEIFSFRAGDPLPAVTSALLFDPRVLWATAIFGVRNVKPFTHLGVGVGVPFPLITEERCFFPLDGLEQYPHAEPHRSPYYPPKAGYP